MKPRTAADLMNLPGVTVGPTAADGIARLNAEHRAMNAAPASEKSFMAEVIALAKGCGWRVYHTHDSRRSESGFPDLCMVRDRCIVAELKAGSNRATAAQLDWLDWFRAAKVPAYLWYPRDMPAIVEVLR